MKQTVGIRKKEKSNLARMIKYQPYVISILSYKWFLPVILTIQMRIMCLVWGREVSATFFGLVLYTSLCLHGTSHNSPTKAYDFLAFTPAGRFPALSSLYFHLTILPLLAWEIYICRPLCTQVSALVRYGL